ncbi:hypothetical protein [Candidatus Symbiopectobacterium sp.]|uniref:hypothetical protein n=1 Tax=Candidatus Symbiopectobacterium sp. TaxID=2816440 RepID=UPI0025BFCC49|nr:hypothetical protein [Candidatus Symbiopectobacterium sp.]
MTDKLTQWYSQIYYRDAEQDEQFDTLISSWSSSSKSIKNREEPYRYYGNEKNYQQSASQMILITIIIHFALQKASRKRGRGALHCSHCFQYYFSQRLLAFFYLQFIPHRW